MKPAYLYTCSCLLIGLIGGSACRSTGSTQQSAVQTPSAWQRDSLVIDGSDSDWHSQLPTYVSEEKLSYGISNDGVNLYIRIATKDQQEQQKILQGGLTVWVNPQGEKSNESAVGIGFPLDIHNDRDRELMAQARPEQYRDRPVYPEDLKNYSLYGFNQDPEYYDVGQVNPESVQVRINFNTANILIYEAAIPLKAIYPKGNAHFYAGRNLAVGIFVEGVAPQSGNRRGGGGGSGLGVGVGGGMGFGGGLGSGMGLGLSIGSGLGRGGGSRKDRQSTPGKIWQSITVARQPA